MELNHIQGNKIKLTINEIEALPDTTCKKCGSHWFIQTHKLKKVSPLLSRSGKREIIALQSFICAACRHPILTQDKDIENEIRESKSEIPDDVA